eukprot:TRINITY_DN30911_c0_g1_i1.p1 TRINITY_DN30911_c0_g1~~TRINITY_DN30911_c0_g1_i1.p1  ORF type:complete len:288 (+),score=89.74 TRINITY_DN30911_c0_g1_i1:73-864(+)
MPPAAAEKTRFQDLPPFVEDYRPYTVGFGAKLRAIDPIAEAGRMWDRFYRHNSTQAFKDRHYLTREFPEVKDASSLAELGCGVGNTVFPLREEVPGLRVVCCDLSPVAIRLLREHPAYSAEWCTALAHDLTTGPLPADVVPQGGCDCGTMIFCLSAIAPQFFATVLGAAAGVLRSGGVLYFRDYCKGDLAQQRLSHQIGESDHFLMRTCGTCTYFFDEAELREMFDRAGFDCIECRHVQRQIVNHKEELSMQRTWLQAKMRKR